MIITCNRYSSLCFCICRNNWCLYFMKYKWYFTFVGRCVIVRVETSTQWRSGRWWTRMLQNLTGTCLLQRTKTKINQRRPSDTVMMTRDPKGHDPDLKYTVLISASAKETDNNPHDRLGVYAVLKISTKLWRVLCNMFNV